MADEATKLNWLELPSDVMANILGRVGVTDILENAQKVCTAWHKICKNPAMWRVIYMAQSSNPYTYTRSILSWMCKNAVDRSQGQLVDITIVYFADDELLRYVADRSSQLRRLEIACSYDGIYKSWTALEKFLLLEELSLDVTNISKKAIEIAGRCCPMLKTLKVNHEASRHWNDNEGIAIAIGENLPELRHLELIGNRMTNTGLQTILDGCRHLESLDLSECFNINLKGDIGKRCSQQIKCLKLPKDSLKGCLYTDGLDYDDESYNCFDYEDYTEW